MVLKNLKKYFVLHPFLFALYPLLFFYSRNAWLFPLADLPLAISVILAAAAILFLATARLLKDHQKGGIITSFVFLVIFSSGPAATEFWNLTGIYLPQIYALVFVLLIVAFGAIFIVRYLKSPEKLSRILTVLAFLFVLIPLFNIGQYFWGRINVQDNVQEKAGSIGEEYVSPGAARPDIYYIILDAYAHEQTLKEEFQFDNSAFYQYLAGKGFYVVPESRSNYDYTPPSLASSLNMRYLDELDGKIEQPQLQYLIGLIDKNDVADFLKKQGYKTVFVDSGFFAYITGIKTEKRNLSFDEYLAWDTAERLPFGNSLLNSFLANNVYVASMLFRRISPFAVGDGNGVLYAFDEIKRGREFFGMGPLFIFAHISAPHFEYTLDADCNVIPPHTADNRQGYIEKLLCVNKKVEEIVNAILTKSNPPIIIVQSDHGFSFYSDERLARAQKSKNLLALYLPDRAEKVIPRSLTPVNLFRLIFNYYFAADFELLEEKSYHVEASKFPYQLIDVTDEVKF